MSPYVTFFESKIPQKFLKEQKKSFLEKNSLKKVGFGYSRDVYRYDKSTVIKIPTKGKGITGNLIEARAYQIDPNRKAWCSVFPYNGIPLLLMENVDSVWSHRPDSYWNSNKAKEWEYEAVMNELPKWCLYLRDGAQVGYNSSGKLVCYDYAWNRDFNIETEPKYLSMVKETALDFVNIHQRFRKSLDKILVG